MKIKKKRVLIPFLFLFLAVLGLSGLALGSARFPLAEVIAVFTGGGDPTVRLIVLQLRLPRVAGAVLAGVGLAVSGLLLQSATGNDLCSPNIIGVNSGAGFAVMVLLCLFPMAFAVLPLAAFGGRVVHDVSGVGNFSGCGRTSVQVDGSAGRGRGQLAAQRRDLFSFTAGSRCPGVVFGVFDWRIFLTDCP